MDNKLAEKLFFSKEAAEYLNITPQRLNTLVKEGKLKPLKKNPSGTIFHIDELEKRKEEQNIFEKISQGGGKGMFQFDTDEKKEALNFATLMNSLGITEQKLDPMFTEFSKNVDVSDFMVKSSELLDKYSSYFKVNVDRLAKDFEFAHKAFSNLRPTDEIIKRGSSDYAPLLLKTQQAPRFLYLRGNKALLFEERTVALVGSRQASEKAKENTKRLAATLGSNGITIISGLAKGIDVTAHTTALEYGFNTIAVIGTNLNQYYPAENKPVQLEIEKKGLIVSQFSPATKTKNWFFPLRNGVMSGLSLATVIMEAGETSGALKQADFALKQHREVLIPKNALDLKTIKWPAIYVSRGAKVVESPKKVLEILADTNIFKIENQETYKQQSFADLISEGIIEDKPIKEKRSTQIVEGV
jgi:hypothetical protein